MFGNKGRCEGKKEWHEPFPATDGTTATMLLLLFHLSQDGIFLNLDKIPSLLLAKAQPEILDPFPLLRGTSAPYLAIRRMIWRISFLGSAVTGPACGTARPGL